MPESGNKLPNSLPDEAAWLPAVSAALAPFCLKWYPAQGFPGTDALARAAVKAYRETIQSKDSPSDCDGDWKQHDDAYKYTDEFVSYAEIDALHALVHPNAASEGLYRENNTGGCTKYYCLHHVPCAAETLKDSKLKAVPNGTEQAFCPGCAADDATRIVYCERHAAK